MKTTIAALVATLALGGIGSALAKIPAPPPLDEKAQAAADAKKKAAAEAAEKEKASLAASQDRAVKNHQATVKKMGKPAAKPAKAAPKKS